MNFDFLNANGRITLAGAPEGFDALLLARMSRESGSRAVVFVARDDVALARMDEGLSFFAPDIARLLFPAWDCLPYDRVSPNGGICAARIDTLTRLMSDADGPRIVLTTVSAFLQRVPPKESFSDAVLEIFAGCNHSPGQIAAFLQANGYGRSTTVMEPGEYAMRGGIVDVFPSGAPEPLRLDFFGDELETIRTFDPSDQRTTGNLQKAYLKPVSEVPLDDDAVARFRTGYRELFGAAGSKDALYQGVSEGRRMMGMEHWVALFYPRMGTLLDYLPDAAVVLDHQVTQAREARLDLIAEYYSARKAMETSVAGQAGGDAVYHPAPPERLYLDANEWDAALKSRTVVELHPFAAPDSADVRDQGARPGRTFNDVRVDPSQNVFDALGQYIQSQQSEGRRVVIGAFSQGSLERLIALLTEHGTTACQQITHSAEIESLERGVVAFALVGLERGFVTDDLCAISEQDILGERLSRSMRKKVKPENIIAEASSLNEGDLIVHAEHGIGRYEGLVQIEAMGAQHDCLKLVYAGETKLFLPVENIDVISRFGSEQAGAQLDRLGGAAWQARKAHMKKRLKDMAEALIKVAAERQLRECPRAVPDAGAFDEFCARFPFGETEDQARAIADVMDDLAMGRPTDRLVCGDVGFGKTEVALRAAFIAALSGRQVAVVVPTTLLCRQHYRNFQARFADFPVRVEQLSRLVSNKDAKAVKAGLADGSVDIVIGTHALVSKDVRFKDLGLLIVDEEQHFGVGHKEQLKQIGSSVHVLTLTATPIPRTLQLALSGVREMSLIATPPVDRLAVRTYVLPFDPVIVREAILRERFRGGQTFYVCPRIEDQRELSTRLQELVPEVKIATVNGRMTPADLEDTISNFSDGHFDVLLSTNIIESGLDMPSVNTIIIHRADMFGLAQLYQLRGRVGRSKTRAYAYLTLPEGRTLTPSAQKRLDVMQTLDALGAGFTLASHDLDIRGAGNLLGGEQSGHIREVGIELYQQMLEEAVAEARGGTGAIEHEEWSPQVSIGVPVLLPESYIADLNVRLELYRRVARLTDENEREAFAAELIDRFGSLPVEVKNLLQIVALKQLCRLAHVAKIDAGPKGAVVSFHKEQFPNPAGLVGYINDQVGTAKLRPDHCLVLKRGWDGADERLDGVRRMLQKLADIAQA